MKNTGGSWRTLYLVAAALLLAHHAFGIFLTVRLELAVGVPLLTVGSLAPYTGFALLVAVALALGLTRRWRWGAALFVLAFLLSAGLFAYDFTHARWQMNGFGQGAVYTLWWWYYEPFWYNYRPGNI